MDKGTNEHEELEEGGREGEPRPLACDRSINQRGFVSEDAMMHSYRATF